MHATATKRKPATRSAKTTRKPDLTTNESESDDGVELSKLKLANQILDIDLKTIKTHEHNRALESDETIDELAQSIEQLGQLEPATVRRLDHGEYEFELLSGERRYRALRKLGRETIRATVVSEGTAEGLVRLAAANSQRRDLNPIERAELIALLMKPLTEGGSGLSLSAAGLAVGLNSDNGIRNALRMLRLPKSIKELVQSGDLSERASRKLIPFVDHPAIMREIERNLKHDEHRIELAAEERWPWWLQIAIEENTRPMDDVKYSARELVKGCYQSYPMLFEPTEDQMALLKPFKLVDGDETLLLTSHVKLWDSLQRPLVEARFNDERTGTRKKANAPKDSKSTDKKPTPAQGKAENARKAKEAKERLERFTVLWITYALRCQLAERASDETRYATLGFLVQSMNASHDIRVAINAAYVDSNLKMTKVGKEFGEPETIPETNEYCWIEDWWANMLWPSSANRGSKAKGCLPDLDRLPQMSGESVRKLAVRCKVTIMHFWKSAAEAGSEQRELLALWLGRHTTEQLNGLCNAMGKTTMAEKRSELVEFLLSHHRPSQLLPMPKELADGSK